jgi:hypothetical protein
MIQMSIDYQQRTREDDEDGFPQRYHLHAERERDRPRMARLRKRAVREVRPPDAHALGRIVPRPSSTLK